MEIKDVPQDAVSTYADNKKAVYATDEEGHYSVIASSGWHVEGEATLQALDEFQRQAAEAYQQVIADEKSPLFYHMYAQRMNVVVLAQSVGMFQWRVKRHFRPAVFRALAPAMLNRYSDVLGVDMEALRKVPQPED